MLQLDLADSMANTGSRIGKQIMIVPVLFYILVIFVLHSSVSKWCPTASKSRYSDSESGQVVSNL